MDGPETDDALAGRWYADTFHVGHNAFQFAFDCGHDDDALATVYLRVLTNPASARELFRLLGVALLQYADAFGPISERGAPGPRSGP
jgi:hypothetical protein